MNSIKAMISKKYDLLKGKNDDSNVLNLSCKEGYKEDPFKNKKIKFAT